MLEIKNEGLGKPITDRRVTSDYLTKNGKIRHARMNANIWSRRSRMTGNQNYLGECNNIREFKYSVNDVLYRASISTEDVQFLRIDFKFDFVDETKVQEWIKFCDLLIGAFVVKHHVTEKNQYRGKSLMQGSHKSTKAKWGRWEIENYNKSIQQSGRGVAYRLEIRCLDAKQKPIEEVLRAWIKELKSLIGYYDEALEDWSMVLGDEWNTLQNSTHLTVHLNDFIIQHSDFIFSRAQLRLLYEQAGVANPARAAKRYCDKCSREDRCFISKSLYEGYIKTLCGEIEKYLL